MVWKDKQCILKEKYELKETRVVKKFLLFPKKLGCIWKWLETVTITQHVIDKWSFCEMGGVFDGYKWADKEWVEDE